MRVVLDRAIVLRQPWAQAVVDGAFPALVRTLRTNHRGQVGVLAARNPDPAGFAAPNADCPLGAIVGAVEISSCVPVEGDPHRFLAERFGREIARFYPDHFLPDAEETFAWILSEAVPAETPRPWDEPMPRTWAKCNTWVEGNPIPLAEDAPLP